MLWFFFLNGKNIYSTYRYISLSQDRVLSFQGKKRTIIEIDIARVGQNRFLLFVFLKTFLCIVFGQNMENSCLKKKVHTFNKICRFSFCNRIYLKGKSLAQYFAQWVVDIHNTSIYASTIHAIFIIHKHTANAWIPCIVHAHYFMNYMLCMYIVYVQYMYISNIYITFDVYGYCLA